MNTFQNCYNTSDAVPLYLPQQLFLKPIARLSITLQLPSRTMGKNISNWEIMEGIRTLIKPDVFTSLKVTKTNLEFVRLEAEIDTKSKLDRIISKVNNKLIKLKEFPELMKLRASEAKLNFPIRHTWDAFFRESKDMNEMKSGERPDTMYLSNLPIKWFVSHRFDDERNIKPSEKLFYRIFDKYGRIRNVDIPICDPYRNKMKPEVSGMLRFDFDERNFFEGYVQFKDYVGFSSAMEAFRGMKLLHKEDGETYAVDINVDFDRSKHLSDASIRRREIVRDRLVKKEISKEERKQQEQEEENNRIESERQEKIDQRLAKEQRRQDREERRKARLLAKLKISGSDEINEKIAKEEKKLLKVQKKLEAVRLVEELFRRIKVKKEKVEDQNFNKSNNNDEISRLKTTSEIEVRQQKDKLNHAIEGRVVLKAIMSKNYHRSYNDSSSSDESKGKEIVKKHSDSNGSNEVQFHPNNQIPILPNWYNYPPTNGLIPYQISSMYPSTCLPYQSRGRGPFPGSSRGSFNSRRRGGRFRGNNRHSALSSYPPELQAQYYRYFEKFLDEHDDRHYERRSYSRSNSREKSSRYSKHRSRKSPSRSRHFDSRSRSKSRARSLSRSTSRSRSRNRKSSNRSRSRNRRKARSRSRRSSRDTTRNSSRHRRTRSNSRHSKDRRSQSPSNWSVDSAKFLSPKRLRAIRSKSVSRSKDASSKKSWSNSP